MSALPLTPEQQAARRVGKLDQRCHTCGAFSAASARCYWCASNDLEYRIHVPSAKPGEPGERIPQWCQTGVARVADPAHPLTGRPRAPRHAVQGENASGTARVLSSATRAYDGTLGLT